MNNADDLTNTWLQFQLGKIIHQPIFNNEICTTLLTKPFFQKIQQMKEERDQILQKMDASVTPLENQRLDLVRQLEIVDMQLNEDSPKRLFHSTSVDCDNTSKGDPFAPSCPPPYSP